MRSFRLALSFLTVFPAGELELSVRGLAEAAPFFPLVGALLGLGYGVAGLAIYSVAGAAPAAVLVLMLNFLSTRGLHLDGVADTADALVGGIRREKALQIMKDGAAGPMGVSVLILLHLGKYAALTSLPAERFFPVLLLMPLAGRWAMVLAGAAGKAARREGLGLLFISALGWKDAFSASLIALFPAGAVLWLYRAHLFPLVLALPLALAGSFLLAAGLGRKLGGLTGDTLGAVCEGAELLFLWLTLP